MLPFASATPATVASFRKTRRVLLFIATVAFLTLFVTAVLEALYSKDAWFAYVASFMLTGAIVSFLAAEELPRS